MKDKLKKYMAVELAVVIGFILIDYLTKMYAEANLVGKHFNLIPYLFNVTYHQNRGAAFGMLQGSMVFFYVITAIIVPVLFFYMYKTRGEKMLHKIGLALIIAGAIGNAIDRVFYGYVIDWIDFAFVDFPIFNIADSALTVGSVLLVIYYMFIYKEPAKADKLCGSQNADSLENNVCNTALPFSENPDATLGGNDINSDNSKNSDDSCNSGGSNDGSSLRGSGSDGACDKASN